MANMSNGGGFLRNWHVRCFRKREEWQQRVKRYKPRLCLIFPPGAAAVAEKRDASKGEAKR